MANDISLEERSAAACEFILANQHMLASLNFPAETPRLRLAVTLLHASTSHGYTAAKLVNLSVADFGISAAALLRPQVDTLLRGILFAMTDETSDADVDSFIHDDKLPLRPDRKGERKTITLSQMSAIATRLFERFPVLPDPDKFERMIKASINDMHGLIHGGNVLLHLHNSGDGHVSFSPPMNSLTHLLRNVSSMSGIPWVVAMNLLAQQPLPVASAALKKAYERFARAFDLPTRVS
ncbi:DUF6988 family protein [Rhodanobacter ginsengisoli]|uniref:DUF6988 family protein n=1 Tax=Rhodanobacter ginsengisoli TaxID=418646 RepID=A0ABW0QPY7_9GAMM